MNNDLIKRGMTAIEEYDFLVVLEAYKKINVEDLVVEICVEKGFISKRDITLSKAKYIILWQYIVKIHSALKLIDDFNDKDITKDNIEKHFENKLLLADRIVKIISERVIVNLPLNI
ncbi:hypothetical protein [Photobacterium leiognathi]|uniref:hypothetical protein n=1 Tax=Photobacterium leiognathi TaxID=553611 RepID=UPI002981849D|nr:hypothetical protein [Photobacterium leiognathi]